jgi:hypothetical protein
MAEGKPMSGVQRKNFSSPGETRKFSGHGHADLVNLASGPVGMGTLEPGWRWSNDVKPLAGPTAAR